MQETLNWIIEYMTDNGLSDEEVQHFLNTKHPLLENETVMAYLRKYDGVYITEIKRFVENYMLGI